VQEAAQAALTSITSAIFILLAVGALIGAWNLSGTIPAVQHRQPGVNRLYGITGFKIVKTEPTEQTEVSP
jgi:hypothetical protein